MKQLLSRPKWHLKICTITWLLLDLSLALSFVTEVSQDYNQSHRILCTNTKQGTMDTAAYMTAENFDVLLDDYNWNVVDLRDKRYDAVIHLVTAAIGAEKFYTTENNAARSEDLSQARDLDFKVLNAWVGHPHIRIVDNSTGFSQKINRVEEVICQVVGAPRPTKGERKFILSGDSTISGEVATSAGIKVETFIVEQTYLTKTDSQFEVRNVILIILVG